MHSTLKCLSTKSGKAVFLIVETKSYIFNIFEGFQRYCIETNISLKYIHAVFIPNKKCIPPLCGLYLTLRDMNITSLRIVCSSEIKSLIKQAFEFCPPKSLEIIFCGLEYEDEFLSVTDQYTLQIKNFRGRFRVEDVPKCIPKYFYKDLVDGKTIKVDDEYCKGEDFLEPDITFKPIHMIFNNNIKIDEGSKILCFTKRDYYKYKSYDVWYINRSTGIDFVAQYNLLVGLYKISPDYHLPFLFKRNRRIIRTYILGCKLRWRWIKPFKFIRFLNSTDHFTYNKEVQDFIIKRNECKTALSKPEETTKYEHFNGNSLDANFVFILGSGCAIPSKYRNVTGILASIEDKAFLLDCGEDSLQQLLRHYGSYKILERVKLIFISHSHGDHSLGLVNFLSKIKHKVIVFAPQCILNFVASFHLNVIPFSTDHAKLLEQKYYNYDILNNSISKDDAISSYKFYQEASPVEISICGCVHCTDSCSVSIKYKGIKVSFSGDTRPSNLFAHMANKSDVLIHESTFDNESLDKAIKTKHSTLNEACDIFRKSQSKELLLTHFSQRYPKKFSSESIGIPCYDFYKYNIGKSIFMDKEINDYLHNM